MRNIRDMTLDDIKGKASDDEAAFLRGEVLELWRAALVDASQDIQKQLTQRKADLAGYQQDCLRKGEAGRLDYFDAKAEYEEWRGAAMAYKGSIERRLREAKAILSGRGDGGGWKDEVCERLERIEALLDKLTASARSEIDGGER